MSSLLVTKPVTTFSTLPVAQKFSIVFVQNFTNSKNSTKKKQSGAPLSIFKNRRHPGELGMTLNLYLDCCFQTCFRWFSQTLTEFWRVLLPFFSVRMLRRH